MKDKKKKVKKIAQQIVSLENKCHQTNNIDERNKYMIQIQKLIENLSLTELLQIDEYIVENSLLTK